MISFIGISSKIVFDDFVTDPMLSKQLDVILLSLMEVAEKIDVSIEFF